MRWPRKLWLGFWILVLPFSSGFFLLEIYFRAMGNGVAVGARRFRDEYHLICGIHTIDGQVWYYRSVIPTEFDYPDKVVESHTRRWEFLGFRYIPYFATPRDWYYAAGVPFWFLVVPSGIIIFRTLRKPKYLPGTCEACGYDLRASRDRCPECGNAIAPVATQAV
ncbi:MAG TPA: hypothetical protein VGQ99_08215 [Tepidisphaeraceae bacterium]|jgi:hypothetical protein|nr:hypothetical protein [Tepidisphaeraceae bacterium]